jgi:hypothetical protein
MSVLSRFWEKVDKTDGCWVWIGAVSNKGYGNFWDGVNYVHAHRFSWQLHNGIIPNGLFVCHTCDNRKCVRDDHLFLGTNDDNMKDAVRKGRMASGDNHGLRKHPECNGVHLHPEVVRGERNGNAILTNERVFALRRMGKLTIAEKRRLAEEYGVGIGVIWSVLSGKTWKHLLED